MKRTMVLVLKDGVKPKAEHPRSDFKEEMEERFVTNDGTTFIDISGAKEHDRQQDLFKEFYNAMGFTGAVFTLSPREIVQMMIRNEAKIRAVCKMIRLNPSIVHKGKNVKQEKVDLSIKADPPLKDFKALTGIVPVRK